jgi:siroheme synthase
MAVANLRAIASALVDGGRAPATPAVAIENASMPAQRIIRTTLSELADVAEQERLEPPAVVVIGDVVSGRPDAAGGRP